MSIFTIVTGILTLLGGLAGVVSLFYVRPTRRKLVSEAQKAGAEASQIVAAGATLLLEPLQARIRELEHEAHRLKEKLTLADGEANQLRTILERERIASREVIEALKLEVLKRDEIIARFMNNGTGGEHDSHQSTGMATELGSHQHGYTPPELCGGDAPGLG